MKRFFPLLLLLAIVSASLFMIWESGEYYNSTFYKSDFRGYWASFLVEAFLAISAMFHLRNHKLLNICVKLVMIPLFLVVVVGASLKVVAPKMSELSSANAQKELLSFLSEEQQRTNAHLALFEGQRTNTALTVKHQRLISEQYITELKQKNSQPWMILIVICFSTFLRFSVQLANLVFAHSFGVLWRDQGLKSNTQARRSFFLKKKPRRGRPLGSKNKPKNRTA